MAQKPKTGKREPKPQKQEITQQDFSNVTLLRAPFLTVFTLIKVIVNFIISLPMLLIRLWYIHIFTIAGLAFYYVDGPHA